jgi:hypothetical protein
VFSKAPAELRELFCGDRQSARIFDKALPEKLDQLDALGGGQLADSLGGEHTHVRNLSDRS